MGLTCAFFLVVFGRNDDDDVVFFYLNTRRGMHAELVMIVASEKARWFVVQCILSRCC